MAKDCSFDVVSEFDKQELVNAIDQVKRDLSSRFDLKNSNSTVDLEADKSITITTNDEMKLRNIYDILQTKLVKRGLSRFWMHKVSKMHSAATSDKFTI